MAEVVQSAAPSEAPEAPPKVSERWQFSLRDLLWLTTGAGLVSLLVTLHGLGGLPLGIGLLVTVCNWRGLLAPLQGDRRGRMIKLAIGFLAISLVLPAVPTCNNDYMVGWQVARACATAQIELPDASVEQIASYVRITLLNVLNLLLIASPWWLTRLAKGKGQFYGAVLGFTAVLAWSLALQDFLYVGYYCWAASALLVLCAWRPGWRTLAAMLLQAAGWLYFVHREWGPPESADPQADVQSQVDGAESPNRQVSCRRTTCVFGGVPRHPEKQG